MTSLAAIRVPTEALHGMKAFTDSTGKKTDITGKIHLIWDHNCPSPFLFAMNGPTAGIFFLHNSERAQPDNPKDIYLYIPPDSVQACPKQGTLEVQAWQETATGETSDGLHFPLYHNPQPFTGWKRFFPYPSEIGDKEPAEFFPEAMLPFQRLAKFVLGKRSARSIMTYSRGERQAIVLIRGMESFIGLVMPWAARNTNHDDIVERLAYLHGVDVDSRWRHEEGMEEEPEEKNSVEAAA